ncbi:MAG: DNA polymerase [Candidatus Marinimicrobia bacterium]|nr:DNA polymerase [Candidatus Neomarinimicrobiota bacterium]
MRAHVFEKICNYIEQSVSDPQRRNALFLIFSELLQGNELGLDYLVTQFGTYTNSSIGRSTIQRLLKQAQTDGLIVVDIYGHRITRRAHHYTFTPKGFTLIRESAYTYWTFYDYQRKRKTRRVSDLIRSGDYHIPEHAHYADWIQMLPQSSETDLFIRGLIKLESQTLLFHRYKALQHPSMIGRLYQLRNIPNKPFNVKYRPLRSGRLQSVPHTFLGKHLVPFIRPAEDPHLTDGILFSLDYSSQELRILASMLPTSSLINQWAQNPENHFSELLESYGISIPKHLWKGFMYSFLYGSQGKALADMLSHQEALKMGFNSCQTAARALVSEFTTKVPEIVQLRAEFSEVFVKEHAITAPGGVTRVPDVTEDLTKRGTVKKHRARTIPLSHVIQGTGAYIARTIVAKSAKLKYCRLYMPIHDGFVFYCHGNVYQEAYAEASKLMNEAAEQIIPNIEIPHKTEWIVSNNRENT